MKIKLLFSLELLALSLLLLLAGCGTLSKGTPDKPSPYLGAQGLSADPAVAKLLFEADQSIVTGYELLRVFVTWERNNRAALASFPQIKTSADNVRRHAEEWIDTATRLREAYAASPTPDNRSALADALRVIRQALIEATTQLSTYGPANNNLSR
jgi:hypothetical protein